MSNEIIDVDLHTHNYYSKDSIATPKDVVKQCMTGRVRCLAVTNHNTIQGTEETRQEASSMGIDLMIITGEEITTVEQNPEGKRIEMIALFLNETISPGLTFRQTLREIANQAGVVYIPHPFELWRHGAGEDSQYIIHYAQELNIPLLWEIANARSTSLSNEQSRAYYKRNDRLGLHCVGSDAHHAQEIGRGALMLRKWDGTTPKDMKEGLLNSLYRPQGISINNDQRQTLRFRTACIFGRLNPIAHFPRLA